MIFKTIFKFFFFFETLDVYPKIKIELKSEATHP